MGSKRSDTSVPPGREGKQARLAAALRQNMKRRKAQARARRRAEDGEKTHDSAGFVPEIVSDGPER